MELIDLVSELLYKHNCVIIPDFGGFVGNYKATDFDENRLLVSPSRKKVAFNQSLVENDGLLINALMTKKSISYDQAEKEVRLFTKFLNDRLEKYKNYEFKNVGSLYLNKEGKVIFVAYDGLNFHKKSFGLQDIKVKRLATVVAESKSATIVSPKKEVVEQPAKVVPMPTETSKRRFYLPQVAASVAILALFGVMLWQLLQNSAKYQTAAVSDSTKETLENKESQASMFPDVISEDSNDQKTAEETPESVLPAPERVAENMEFEDVTDEVIQQPEVSKAPPVRTLPREMNKEKQIPVSSPAVTEVTKVPVLEEQEDFVSGSGTIGGRTVYYIAVAKNYTPKIESFKRKKLEKLEYELFTHEVNGDQLLCIEKFISQKNAQDYLSLVKRYDDRYAFMVETQE